MTHASDKILFRRIERATAGGRALLCTLGRLGKTFRHEQPARAGMILLASQSHPLYKGGRLMFDLLELEDLMLDGAQPEPLDSQSIAKSLRSTLSAFAGLTRVLMELADQVSAGGGQDQDAPEDGRTEDAIAHESATATVLLDLDSSEYLYDLVVLGVLNELGKATAGDAANLPI